MIKWFTSPLLSAATGDHFRYASNQTNDERFDADVTVHAPSPSSKAQAANNDNNNPKLLNRRCLFKYANSFSLGRMKSAAYSVHFFYDRSFVSAKFAS